MQRNTMIRSRMPRLASIALAASGLVLLWAPSASAMTSSAASSAAPGSATSNVLVSSGAAPSRVTSVPADDTNADGLVWSVKPTDNAIGTGRPNFGYRADPGASVQDSLDVTNRGDATLTLAVHAADAFTPQGGGIDLLPEGRKSVDVGSWISLGGDSITLDPQQTVTVPFTLTVPTDATPGDHAGGIVTTITSGSGTLAVERRLGSRLLVRVSGDLAPRLGLSGLSVDYGTQFDPFSPATATVTYTVANTGNVRLDAHPAIVVSGPFGMLRRAVATEDLGELLPGNSRRFQVHVPAVWAFFHLSARVTLEPFPSNPNDSASQLDLSTVSASTATFALNWGQAILFLVVAALVLAGLRWRRRRARRVQASIDDAVRKALAETTPVQPGAAE
jgi:hypothetical protein